MNVFLYTQIYTVIIYRHQYVCVYAFSQFASDQVEIIRSQIF